MQSPGPRVTSRRALVARARDLLKRPRSPAAPMTGPEWVRRDQKCLRHLLFQQPARSPGTVLFNSLEFLLLFLPLTLVVALRLRGQPLLSWIAGTSVVFYAFAGHWWFIVPMLATTVIDYALAHAIARSPVARRRAALLALSLTVNLGLLAYFKYAGLLTRSDR